MEDTRGKAIKTTSKESVARIHNYIFDMEHPWDKM